MEISQKEVLKIHSTRALDYQPKVNGKDYTIHKEEVKKLAIGVYNLLDGDMTVEIPNKKLKKKQLTKMDIERNQLTNFKCWNCDLRYQHLADFRRKKAVQKKIAEIEQKYEGADSDADMGDFFARQKNSS